MMENAVAALVKLGLTEYEAKVYAAMVGLGEGTVRQIHHASAVPRPRVYDVLEELVTRGFVEERHGNPMCYRAVEPHRVVSKLRQDFEATTKDAVMGLEELNLSAVRKVSPIWYVRGDWSIRSRLEEVVARAQKELLVLALKPMLVKDMAEGIAEASNRANVTCIISEGAKHLADKLGKAKVMEPVASGNSFLDEAFQTKVLRGRIETEKGQYKVECLVLADGNESILVYEVNGERTAFIVELPIITFIQRGLFHEALERSREVSGHQDGAKHRSK